MHLVLPVVFMDMKYLKVRVCHHLFRVKAKKFYHCM